MNVLAVDTSGSVSGFQKYWELVRGLFEGLEVASDGPEAWSVIAWGSRATKLTPREAAQCLNSGRRELPCLGGTDPSVIFDALSQGTAGVNRFVFVTDGEVMQHDVEKFEERVAAHGFKPARVESYVVTQRACDDANLSTVCAFHRCVDARTTVYGEDGRVQKYEAPTPAQLALLARVEELSLAVFEAQYEDLHRTLVMQLMGRAGDAELHAKLVRAKARLTRELAARAEAGGCPRVDSREDMQALVNAYFEGGEAARLAAKIDRLISVAGAGLRGAFSTRQFDLSAVRAPQVVAAPVEEEEEGGGDGDGDAEPAAAEGAFECPVLMAGASVPALLIAEGEPVLAGLPKAQVDAIRRNPLACVHAREVVARVRARVLPYALGAEAVRALQSGAGFRDPFTRRRVVGCIPLGATDAARATADANLAVLFGGGKVLGSADLFCVALYHMVCGEGGLGDPWLANPDAAAVRAAWEAQIDHRLEHATTAVSLSGLPAFPQQRAKLWQAVRFVLASGLLRFPSEGARPLRTHAFVLPLLFGLHERARARGLAPPLEPAAVFAANATVGLLSLLNTSKHEPERWADLCATLEGPWVEVRLAGGRPVIWRLEEEAGAPVAAPPLHPYFAQLWARHAIHAGGAAAEPFTRAVWRLLARRVDPQKRAADLALPDDDDFLSAWMAETAAAPRAGVEHWFRAPPESISAADAARGYVTWGAVPICEATCRPWHAVQQESWRQAVQRKFGVADGLAWQTRRGDAERPAPDRVISMMAWFGRYVAAHGAYPPSAADYWDYVYRRALQPRGAPVPHDFLQRWRELAMDFADVMETLSPQAFAARYCLSAPLAARVLMEARGTPPRGFP